MCSDYKGEFLYVIFTEKYKESLYIFVSLNFLIFFYFEMLFCLTLINEREHQWIFNFSQTV